MARLKESEPDMQHKDRSVVSFDFIGSRALTLALIWQLQIGHY